MHAESSNSKKCGSSRCSFAQPQSSPSGRRLAAATPIAMTTTRALATCASKDGARSCLTAQITARARNRASRARAIVASAACSLPRIARRTRLASSRGATQNSIGACPRRRIATRAIRAASTTAASPMEGVCTDQSANTTGRKGTLAFTRSASTAAAYRGK